MRTLLPTTTTTTTTARANGVRAEGSTKSILAPARADLRAQIARLERELSAAVSAGAPISFRRGPGAGPRLLSLAELERERDALSADLAAARTAVAAEGEAHERARLRLEAMLADPPAHRFERVALCELGEPGCGVYAVRPRLGPIGLLAGWWRVTLSSGCPLARPG